MPKIITVIATALSLKIDFKVSFNPSTFIKINNGAKMIKPVQSPIIKLVTDRIIWSDSISPPLKYKPVEMIPRIDAIAMLNSINFKNPYYPI